MFLPPHQPGWLELVYFLSCLVFLRGCCSKPLAGMFNGCQMQLVPRMGWSAIRQAPTWECTSWTVLAVARQATACELKACKGLVLNTVSLTNLTIYQSIDLLLFKPEAKKLLILIEMLCTLYASRPGPEEECCGIPQALQHT